MTYHSVSLEHVNGWMEVLGGSLGIALNPGARDRFLLTAPEATRLS